MQQRFNGGSSPQSAPLPDQPAISHPAVTGRNALRWRLLSAGRGWRTETLIEVGNLLRGARHKYPVARNKYQRIIDEGDELVLVFDGQEVPPRPALAGECLPRCARLEMSQSAR